MVGFRRVMRIVINDHAGHPFQVQLSRSLASRGHTVLHSFTSDLQTPRGALQRRPDDPAGFDIVPIKLSGSFDRYGLVRRFLQERELGRRLQAMAQEFKPDAVISSNTPLGAQSRLLSWCRKDNTRFIFWLQDLLGTGIKNNVSKKLPGIGHLIGEYYIWLENRLLKKSQAVVAITEDFVPVLSRAGVCEDAVQVIHNWAPLDEMPVLDRKNNWSYKHGLKDTFNFLYSGTLGMKHNPGLLVELALKYRNHPRVRVVVITEGLGEEYLKEKKKEFGLDNLILLPFQPYEELPEVLASADVLLTLLEKDAGVFAVPSKVLTYLCTQRPLLLAVPLENLAAKIVAAHEAGVVVAPDDVQGFLEGAGRLLGEGSLEGEMLREQMGANGRRYAEAHFDIEKITDRFEEIIAGRKDLIN